jgi:HK97 family phage portal protein
MGFFSRLFNQKEVQESNTATTAEAKLLEWLGIDGTKPEAIQETTYFTCLKILSETMGKLPLKLYVEDDHGGRVNAKRTSETDVILNRPNTFMSPAVFWAAMEANCHHYGNAYAWIQYTTEREGKYGGTRVVKALWPMQSNYVTVYMDDAGVFGDKGKLYYRYTDPNSGTEYVFDQMQVLHMKTWLTWDGIMGKSVRDILATTITGAGYSQKYLEKLYESGLTASSVLQYTGDLDEKLRIKLQEKYDSFLTGARNAGKVVALPVGMNLSPLNYKLTDAQFFELKKYSALQIAAAFGVKPNQINDYEKSSYANSETQQLAFLVDTMLYRITMNEQELNYKLLSEEKRINGYQYKFNEKVILRADAETQMKTLTSAVNNGIYTPNEARQYLDLPSKDGGDQLIVNGNYVPLTSVGAAYGISEEGGSGE